nr:unnamed protein product [Callosobruchus chinensis]
MFLPPTNVASFYTSKRNTTHRHQPRYSDLFKFFRGRTPGLIAWAVAMNKPAVEHKNIKTLVTLASSVDL